MFVFLFVLYINRHFARMLNSRAIEFVNISENKVLANKSELTVTNGLAFCSIYYNAILRVFFFPDRLPMVGFSRSEITNEALPGIGVPFLLFPEKSRFVSLLSENDFFLFYVSRFQILRFDIFLSFKPFVPLFP